MPRGVYQRTAEMRANIARARRAVVERGPILTEEGRRKIRETAQKYAKDPAWRLKVSQRTKERMHAPDVRTRHLCGVTNALAQTPHGNNYLGRAHTEWLDDLEILLTPAGYERESVTIPCQVKGRHGHYALDLAHREARINIEIDGSSHKGREEKDKRRDEYLRSLGWKIIRIKI